MKDAIQQFLIKGEEGGEKKEKEEKEWTVNDRDLEHKEKMGREQDDDMDAEGMAFLQ